MRKITANVYMTLDGRGAFPKYPGSNRRSTGVSALFRHMWYDRFDDVTTIVMGRRSFLGHQRTWSEKARKSGEPKWLLDYRRYLDRVEKICLSHRLRSTDWENSRILTGDLARILAKLRREKGGNINSRGGPRGRSRVHSPRPRRRLLVLRHARRLWDGPAILGEDERPVHAPAHRDKARRGRGDPAPLRGGPLGEVGATPPPVDPSRSQKLAPLL